MQLQSLRTIIKKYMTCFYALFTKNVLTTGVNLSMLKIHEHLETCYHPPLLSTHIIRYKTIPTDRCAATTHTSATATHVKWHLPYLPNNYPSVHLITIFSTKILSKYCKYYNIICIDISFLKPYYRGSF